MKRITLLLVLFFSYTTMAGQEAGNGGDGVTINGNLYLLDLVEAGVHRKPYIETDIKILPFIEKELSKSLVGLKSVPFKVLEIKLTEIFNLDKLMAVALIKAIHLYSWRSINFELRNINDEDSPIGNDTFTQLAIRNRRSITINAAAWSKLDAANKAALILHEVIYAALSVEADGNGYKQDSVLAREITGYLFSSEIALNGKRGLKVMVGESLPSSYKFSSFNSADNEYFIRLAEDTIQSDLHIRIREIDPDGRIVFKNKVNEYFFKDEGKVTVKEKILKMCSKMKKNEDEKIYIISELVFAEGDISFDTFTDYWGKARTQVFFFQKGWLFKKLSEKVEVNSSNCIDELFKIYRSTQSVFNTFH